jgi:hypothetical protein
MDAVTYPDDNVQHNLTEGFVGVKVDSSAEDEDTQSEVHEYAAVWTPTLVFTDEEGREIRRSVGYLPPEEMVPELHLADGLHRLTLGDYETAYEVFKHIVDEHPESMRVPEAMYWCGVAGYKRDGKVDPLMAHWKELQQRYPDSEWWQKASFIAG